MISILRLPVAVAIAVSLSIAGLHRLPPPNYIQTGIESEVTLLSVFPVIAALNLATKDDTVVIHVDSPGGEVEAGNLVLEAMKTSKAKNIIVEVHKFAASMAAEIALQSPVLMVEPQSVILIHTVSVSDSNGQEIKILPYVRNSIIDAIDPLAATTFEKFSADLYIDTSLRSFGIFSPQAVLDVADGQDVLEMTGSLLWASDPNYINGQFYNLVALDGLDVPNINTVDDFSTGLLWNKMISFTYHPMLVDLTYLNSEEVNVGI